MAATQEVRTLREWLDILHNRADFAQLNVESFLNINSIARDNEATARSEPSNVDEFLNLLLRQYARRGKLHISTHTVPPC